MTDENILLSFEELLSKLAIELRYEKGDFSGGLYRYRDRLCMLINKDLSVTKKIGVLARELTGKVDFDNYYIVPALREIMEDAGSMGQ